MLRGAFADGSRHGGRAIFSIHRDARFMSNALMDTKDVAGFIDRLVEQEIAVIRNIAGCGIDGWIIYDDLGMQTTTFMSPPSPVGEGGAQRRMRRLGKI